MMSEDSAHLTSLSVEVLDTKSAANWLPTHKPTELSRIKLKNWTQQTVPTMSESAHLRISFNIGTLFCLVGILIY